jgi:hypothetical protein
MPAGILPWAAAGAWELGRRAASSPWFWNVLQLYLYGEQEVELHHLQQAYDRLASEAGAPDIGAQPNVHVPPVGSAQWNEDMMYWENEVAGWPELWGTRCR